MSLPGDRIYLFDTSIWEYTDHSLMASDWYAAVANEAAGHIRPVVVGLDWGF